MLLEIPSENPSASAETPLEIGSANLPLIEFSNRLLVCIYLILVSVVHRGISIKRCICSMLYTSST